MNKSHILQGKKVKLRLMRPEEVPEFYHWAIRSPFWYGEFSDEPEIPSYEKFRDDWKDFYFDGSQPEKGRSFAITLGHKTVGQINYNEIDRRDNSADLDILIYEEKDRGKGYGRDALETLCNYLFDEMNVEICKLETAAMNQWAIKSYQKTGFKVAGRVTRNGVEFLIMELRKHG